MNPIRILPAICAVALALPPLSTGQEAKSYVLKLNRPYKYYSFLVGNDEKDAKTWLLDQIFIPALDEKHALQLLQILWKPPKKNKNKFGF